MQGCVHIVDDDESFRTAMERRLKNAGYAVATYASAQYLLDHLPSEGVPGCILLDVRIPELSGPELQERLSELGSTLPIIFLTGHPDVPTTVRAIKAGADDFLTKPVSSDELLQAVERAIAHHEVTRGLRSELDMVRAHIATLTPRERQVFELVILGNTNKQIARALAGRAHHQGASPQGDGKNARPLLGGTCVSCRAGRRSWLNCRTDQAAGAAVRGQQSAAALRRIRLNVKARRQDRSWDGSNPPDHDHQQSSARREPHGPFGTQELARTGGCVSP